MITESVNRMSETEAPTNPFPGLRPFEFDESHLYFGRDGQSEQLLRKLGGTRFVAVVGTSGSGKSSLVRAGLLPALYGGLMTSAGSNWRVALMRPGNDPIGNLARALNSGDVFGSEIEENARLQTTITEVTLRRGSLGLVEAVRQNRLAATENLLVIADQFEELFRYAQVAADERYQNEAAAFVKLLLEAAHQRELNIYVVLTLRSDYLGDCSLFWDLPEAINEGQYLIPRLTREQRREAITGPVAVGGAEITPRLVNRLLNEMGDNPDQLPILQHALMRTWDKWKEEGRETEPLDLSHYESIGGMSEALSRHADEAYFELPDERSRLIAEKLFKALTEKGKDNRETRRPTELREICTIAEATEEEVKRVVEPFRREGRSFLMPPATVPLDADSLIDISHESLIRNWRRLSGWVEDESRSVRIYQRLAETAALYEKNEAGLWRDPDLQLALDWLEQSRPNEAWAKRYHPGFESAIAFLLASRGARTREAEEMERRRKRELRRTRLIAAVLLVAFIISLASAVYAFRQQKEASRQREMTLLFAAQAVQQKEIAENNSKEAFKQKVFAEQQSQETLKQKGIAEQQSTKAQEAEKVAVNQKQEAEKSRLQAIQQAHIARENAYKAEESRRVAETQRQLAVKEKERAEAEEKQNLHLLYAANLGLSQQAFEDKNILRAQSLLDALTDKRDELGFEWYYLWRRYHSDTATFKGHTDAVSSVALSPDGRTLATASYDKTIKLWDTVTGQELATLKGHPHQVMSVAFSPDGKLLASGGSDSTIRLWDVASKRELATFNGQDKAVFSVAFSLDGKVLATGGFDGGVRLWEVATKQEMATFRGHTGSIRSMAFSSDGKLLATGGNDQTVRLWDIATRHEIATLTDTDAVLSVAFSPDSKMLATGNSVATGGDVKIWDVNTRREMRKLKGHTLAFSPDGKTLATATYNNDIRLWDITNGQEMGTLKGHYGHAMSLAFSSDGSTLASGSSDRTGKLWKVGSRDEMVTLRNKEVVFTVAFSSDGKALMAGGEKGGVKSWDTTSTRELTPFEGQQSTVTVAAFSPDGKMLATASNDKTVKLWDMASHRELATFPEHSYDVNALAFSPDGRILATGSAFGSVKLWDIAAHRELATLGGRASSADRQNFVNALAFSPDGRTLASCAIDTFKLWDIASRQELPAFKGLQGEFFSVAFSPDGKRLAIGSSDSDKAVRLLSVETGEELARLIGHYDKISALAFSPDGKTLATGSDDNLVKLWSTTTYQELVTLKGHLGAISALAFSPDGKILATGSYDRYVKLWYAAKDEEILAQRGREESTEKR